MPLRVLRSQDLEPLLTPAFAFTACERAFRAVADHAWHPAQRETLALGKLRLATSLGFDDAGFVARFDRADGGGGLVSLYRPAATPVALLPWAPLERVRASAVAALATRHMANDEAPCLGVIGTGVQARLHIQALTRVRNVKRVLTAGRTSAQAQAFAARMSRELGGGMSFEAADIGRAAALADVLCVCTDSTVPVLFGNEVRKGCHINATGSTSMDAREVDTNAVLRSKVAVEDKELGCLWAGDLRIPVEEGRVAPEALQTDLADLLKGRKSVRTSEDDITLFKAVGHPAADFYLALAAYEQASERGLGAEVEL